MSAQPSKVAVSGHEAKEYRMTLPDTALMTCAFPALTGLFTWVLATSRKTLAHNIRLVHLEKSDTKQWEHIAEHTRQLSDTARVDEGCLKTQAAMLETQRALMEPIKELRHEHMQCMRDRLQE